MAEDMNQLLRRARQNRTPIAPPLADDAESAADAASSLSAGAHLARALLCRHGLRSRRRQSNRRP